MAKTPEAKAETVKGKKGVGWRYCTQCEHSTKGPRSEKCGKCGEAFPVGKTTRPKTPVAKQLDLESALPLVNAMGGSKALQTAIDAYRKAEETLKQLGGVDRAEALHAKLEELRAVLGK